MSTTLMARLQRIARDTRCHVQLANEERRAHEAQGLPTIRPYTVLDFHSPLALLRLYGDRV